MSKLQNHFQFRIALITAVALLFAQLGALAHAYSHRAQAAAPASHQTIPSSHDFCNDCLNFAPLLATAGTPGALPLVEPQGRGLWLRAGCRSLVDHAPLLAFRSRAPPLAHAHC